jgi:hypothetical protein
VQYYIMGEIVVISAGIVNSVLGLQYRSRGDLIPLKKQTLKIPCYCPFVFGVSLKYILSFFQHTELFQKELFW